APSEAYVDEVWFIVNIILSGIFGPICIGYLPRVIVWVPAKNDTHFIADYKCTSRNGLPQSDTCVSGDSHGQVNELETYKVAQLGLNVPSRIQQHLFGNPNVLRSSPYSYDCQKPKAYINIDGKRAQDPKTITWNTYISQPRDLTAYEYNLYLMRGRSFHSSTTFTKESSRKSLIDLTHDSSLKDNKSLNPAKDSEMIKSASSWAKDQLNKYVNKNYEYNGIINMLANPLFLCACYNEIKSKPGNMSKGTSEETLDGINMQWFEKTGQMIKSGEFRFTPTRRVMIPKPGKSEMRPLSVGSPREKIVQKALTVILEAIWDSRFSNNSYGFRPNKSLHQALYQLYRNGSTFQWVIQGDISKCFDKIPHHIIMERISNTVKCDKTLQLIRKSLTAGYIDPMNGTHVRPTEGTPQGSVLSPLLANIVLNELDHCVAKMKSSFEIGKKRARNPEYDKLTSRIQHLQKTQPGSDEIKALAVQRRQLTSSLPIDPNYKRMMYLRYADDFVILISGNINDAKHIKNRIADIIDKKCGLELHKDKTLITAVKEGFQFLGARCVTASAIKAGLSKSEKGNPSRYRMRMRIEIPINQLLNKLKNNKFTKIDSNGLPQATARRDLVNFTHFEIISFYNQRIKGLLAFYTFAVNLTSLRKVIMFLQLSCALTLALKYKLRTKKQVFNKFGKSLEDPETGAELKIPTTLKVQHKYHGTLLTDHTDANLKTSWFKKVTKS
uniref:hypothetical protein n=1 Tax=Exserohilum turcicum TaxID=93612 RepID=UPI0020014B30